MLSLPRKRAMPCKKEPIVPNNIELRFGVIQKNIIQYRIEGNNKDSKS